MDNSLASTPAPRQYGTVSGALAQAFAWLNSPARIHNEIAAHEAAVAAGDTSPATLAQLADWRHIRDAQRRLLAEAGGAQ